MCKNKKNQNRIRKAAALLLCLLFFLPAGVFADSAPQSGNLSFRFLYRDIYIDGRLINNYQLEHPVYVCEGSSFIPLDSFFLRRLGLEQQQIENTVQLRLTQPSADEMPAISRADGSVFEAADAVPFEDNTVFYLVDDWFSPAAESEAAAKKQLAKDRGEYCRKWVRDYWQQCLGNLFFSHCRSCFGGITCSLKAEDAPARSCESSGSGFASSACSRIQAAACKDADRTDRTDCTDCAACKDADRTDCTDRTDCGKCCRSVLCFGKDDVYSCEGCLYVRLSALCESKDLPYSVFFDSIGGLSISTDASADAKSLMSENNRSYIEGRMAYMRNVQRRLTESDAMYLEYLFRRAAVENNVPQDLIMALCRTESCFTLELPHSQAIGLMQLMPRTVKGAGWEPEWVQNTRGNIEFGAIYIANDLKRFGGNELLALSAYNQGVGKVRSGEFSTAYAEKVLGFRSAMTAWCEKRGYSNSMLSISEKVTEQKLYAIPGEAGSVRGTF